MTEPSAGLPWGRGRRLSPHLSHKAIKWKVPGLGREQVLAGGGTGLIRAARPCTHRRDLLSGPVTAFQSDIKLVPLSPICTWKAQKRGDGAFRSVPAAPHLGGFASHGHPPQAPRSQEAPFASRASCDGLISILLVLTQISAFAEESH